MDSFDLPPEYHKTIGVLVTQISRLERVIIICIKYCCSISTQDEVASLVGSDQLDALCKKFEKLVGTNLKDEAGLLAQFQSFRGQLFSINDERNTYVHSFWQIPPLSILASDPYVEQRKYFRVFNQTKGLEDVKPASLADMNKLISKILDTISKLTDFVFGNIDAIRAAVERRKTEFDKLYTLLPEPPEST